MELSAQAMKLKEWILAHDSSLYVIHDEGDRIILSSRGAEGSVVFNELDIIEYQIVSLTGGEPVFYLHFQLHDMHHAMKLFTEMEGNLINYRERRKVKVLLSCSSALTTSYFSEKLNAGAQLLGSPYEFTAVSCDRLYKEGFSYDVILLAPQISFRLREFAQIFSDKPVLEIPGSLYGKYDTSGIIRLIEQALKKSEKESGSESIAMNHSYEGDRKILTIMTRLDRHFRIIYRIVDHDHVTPMKTVIKDQIDVHDFEDILDTVSSYDDDLDCVVISVPGMVAKGKVSIPELGFYDFDMHEWLSRRYPYHFLILNNANATALGLYAVHNSYSAVVYHSQLSVSYRGGEGTVIRGQLITGKNGIAGEVNYVLRERNDALIYPALAAEACAEALTSSISIVGPDAVWIRCDLIPEAKAVRDILERRFPLEYVPEIFTIKDVTEYTLLGEEVYAESEYEKQGSK